MLTKIPIDIIKEIFYYLPNESIFKLESCCRSYSSFRQDKRLSFDLINRKHPMVFNICDNFCQRCNWLPFIKICTNKDYLLCYHF